MAYHKQIFEDADYDALMVAVNSWKSSQQSIVIVSETITKNSVYKDTIIYTNGT